MNGTIGVVGGGRMGAGIAQVFAVADYRTMVIESDVEAAAAARQRIEDGIRKAIQHGALQISADVINDRIEVRTSISELPGDAQLVVEAVPEDALFKRGVLAEIELAVGASCVLASNTSSMSITELASALKQPERFLGMHFFNPVPSSSLVEVVVGLRTADEVVERAKTWIRELGKERIVVRDSPGFATSRLGVLLGLEAIRMLEEGVASAEDIDRAMELGYRHPMGPLRSTDLVGLDVRLAIAEYLCRMLGDRFSPPRLLKLKVDRGELGRKSGQGFFRWD